MTCTSKSPWILTLGMQTVPRKLETIFVCGSPGSAVVDEFERSLGTRFIVLTSSSAAFSLAGDPLLIEALRMSDLVIAVFASERGDKRQRLVYEIGIARGLGKPIAVVSEGRPPATLRDLPFIPLGALPRAELDDIHAFAESYSGDQKYSSREVLELTRTGKMSAGLPRESHGLRLSTSYELLQKFRSIFSTESSKARVRHEASTGEADMVVWDDRLSHWFEQPMILEVGSSGPSRSGLASLRSIMRASGSRSFLYFVTSEQTPIIHEFTEGILLVANGDHVLSLIKTKGLTGAFQALVAEVKWR